MDSFASCAVAQSAGLSDSKVMINYLNKRNKLQKSHILLRFLLVRAATSPMFERSFRWFLRCKNYLFVMQKRPVSHPTAIAAHVRCNCCVRASQLLRTCIAIAAYVHHNCCGIVRTPFSHRRKPLFASSLGGIHAAGAFF